MVKSLENIKSKAGFVLAVALAALVGGLTTNLVRADVPDSDGVIHACYWTNKGDVRVIDTDSDSCSNKETAIDLGSGYGNLKPLKGVDTSDLNMSVNFVNFKNADFTDTTFVGLFTNSDFRGADFTDSLLGAADFSGSNFSGVDLTGLSISSTFNRADLSNTNLTNVIFDGADLLYADLNGATLTGVVWGANTRCPDGTSSGDHSDTCIGYLVP